MKHLTIVAATLALAISLGATAFAGDCASCEKAWAKSDWCQPCSKGYFGDMALTSKKLHAALSGKEIPAEKAAHITCGGCKTALAKNTGCEPCNVEFVNGRVYRSSYAAALARGHRMEWSEEKAAKAAKAKAKAEMTNAKKDHAEKEEQGCKGCKSATRSAGWCSDCNVGFVGQYTYKDRTQHLAAKKAQTILQRASAMVERCESCAVAMATDDNCSSCNVTYKGGKKIRL